MQHSTQSRIIKPVLAAAALVAAASAAWVFLGSRPVGTPASRVAVLDFRPDAEQLRTIESLRAGLSKNNPHFSTVDARQKSNAKLFTYMAATSDDPLVVHASLEAIQSSYSPRSSRKEAPDADLDRVLLKHLESDQNAIAAAAFAAVRVPLMTDEPAANLTLAVARMAAPSAEPARCYAAVEALNLIRPNRRRTEVLEALEAALAADQPQIVSAALFALAQSGPSFEADQARQKDTLGSRVVELATHGDPGVRGNALALLSALDWLVEPTVRSAKAHERLSDAHPYVRAQAAALLDRVRQRSAIHDLIELVGDMALAQYELVGWTALDGSPGRLGHALPGRRSVAEAALYAIRSLSSIASTPPTPGAAGMRSAGHDPEALTLTLGGPQQTDELLRRNAEHARTWYRSAREHLPR